MEFRDVLPRKGNRMREKTKRILLLLLCTFLISSVFADSKWKAMSDTPVSPAAQWLPKKSEDQKLKLESVPIPAEAQNRRTWTLTDLINLALQVSPTTRTTWFATQAAAAGVQS